MRYIRLRAGYEGGILSYVRSSAIEYGGCVFGYVMRPRVDLNGYEVIYYAICIISICIIVDARDLNR